jgi:hypothetical protein
VSKNVNSPETAFSKAASPETASPKIVITEQSALHAVLDMAERRIALLEARLASLEAAPASQAESESTGTEQAPLQTLSSRRGLFKLAGAVATGAVAQTLLSAQPAAAADGANLIIGNAGNAATLTTTLTKTNAAGGAGLRVVSVNSISGADQPIADGIQGVSGSSSAACGVNGYSASGYGVVGFSSTGYSVFADGNGRIGMVRHTVSGVPTSGTYDEGDIIRDDSGNMFVCVTGGPPAGLTSPRPVWRKIAGPGTAGQLHFLATPTRAYDSRSFGVVAANTDRVISVAAQTPAGTVGVSLSVTITGTGGSGGYLAVFPGGQAWPGNSNLNWFGANQNVATSVTTAVDASRNINVRAGDNSTHVIIDVIGYYL